MCYAKLLACAHGAACGTLGRCTRPPPASPAGAAALRPRPDQRRPRRARRDDAGRCSATSTRTSTRSCSTSSTMLRRVYRDAGRARAAAPLHGDRRHGGGDREPGRAGRHGDRRAVRVLRTAYRRDRAAARRGGGGGRGRLGGMRLERRVDGGARSASPTRGWSPSCTPRPPPASSIRSRELGAAMRDRDTLLMADCVTSLAGVPLDVGAWGVDFAYSCTQKCLAAPPGMSPVAVSERAMERLRSRRTPVPFSFDLLLLERYWVERPGDLPPHGADPRRSTRSTRRSAGCCARGSRSAGRGTPRRPRHLQAALEIARPRAPRRPGAPARAAHRGAGARRRGRQGRAGPDAARARHRDRRRPRARRAGHVADRPDGPERDGRDGRPGAGGAGRGSREEAAPALALALAVSAPAASSRR